MAKRTKCIVGLMGALCLAVVTAEAGSKLNRPVVVRTEGTDKVAEGAVGTVRSSANTVEMIGCYVEAGDTWIQTVCYAQAATGPAGFLCQTSSERIFQAASTITPASWIRIRTNQYGRCTALLVQNDSRNPPMVP
jgi:hypothetical protein